MALGRLAELRTNYERFGQSNHFSKEQLSRKARFAEESRYTFTRVLN